MAGYLLDTCALSAFYFAEHKFHDLAKQLFDQFREDDNQFVSVITMAEIDFGVLLAEKTGTAHIVEMKERADLIRQHAGLEIGLDAAKVYSELKSTIAENVKVNSKHKRPRYLEDWINKHSSKALALGENDLWLCTQAIARDLTLVTTDAGFARFKASHPALKLSYPEHGIWILPT